MLKPGEFVKKKIWRMSMHFKWNNTFSRVLASSVAVLVATSLNAIPRDPCQPPPPPVCCAEPAPGPFAFSYPFDVDLNCPRDFYFHVDGLAMQAKQQGMDIAIIDANATSTAPLTRGKLEGFSSRNRDWDYQPGMRIGAGFYLNHDAWNLDFNWTWLNITDYKKANAQTPGVLVPFFMTGINTPTAVYGTTATANWHAKYNTLDIRLGKPYYVSRYLVMNPHFGVRGASIRQHFSAHFFGTTPTAGTVHHGDNDFWGVGSRAGLDSKWILGKGWCLMGNIAASLLFGKFEIKQNMQYGSGATPSDGFDVDSDYFQNIPNFEIILGVGWGRFVNKQKLRIGFEAAYEFHEWWDQLNYRKFYSGSAGAGSQVGAYLSEVTPGNLSLNGFSLKFQLDM
jgi:hypothetical protein